MKRERESAFVELFLIFVLASNAEKEKRGARGVFFL